MQATSQVREAVAPRPDNIITRVRRWRLPLVWYQRLTLVTAVAIWGLIVLGGLVRTTDSGRGCGATWPMCEGRLLPRLEYHLMVEWTHRLFGVLCGILMAVTIGITLLWYRRPRRLMWMALAAGVTYLAQAILGGITVLLNLSHVWVAAHMGNSMLLLASVTLLAAFARLGPIAFYRPNRGLRWLATGTLIWTYAALFTGSAVVGADADTSCPSWPMCSTSHLLPDADFNQWVNFGHRLAVSLSDVLMLVLVIGIWRLRRQDKRLLNSSHVLAALYVSQVFLGGATVLLNAPEMLKGAHLALAAATWAALVIMTTFIWIGPKKTLTPLPSPTNGRGGQETDLVGGATRCDSEHNAQETDLVGGATRCDSEHNAQETDLVGEATRPDSHALQPALSVWAKEAWATVGAYVSLARLRVIPLLLVPTVAAMLIAAVQQPPTRSLLELIALTMLGGTLATGGAHTINQYCDRDIDARMKRTKKRAVVTGQIAPWKALAFGIALSVAGVIELGLTVNWVAGALSLAGNAFYILVYTLWLKRTSDQNIVIGGAAGAVPPLVGWAAVTGGIGLPAILFFAIIFFWTPAHFWALSLVRQDDYKAAGIPMLPVVRGEAATLTGILAYTLLLAASTVLPFAVNALGPLYFAFAAVLGIMFIVRAVGLRRKSSMARAWKLFKFSNTYLALLYAAMVADRVLSLGWRPFA